MHHYLYIFRVTERGQVSFCASNVDKCYLKDSWYYNHWVHRIIGSDGGRRRGKTFPCDQVRKERERERERAKRKENG